MPYVSLVEILASRRSLKEEDVGTDTNCLQIELVNSVFTLGRGEQPCKLKSYRRSCLCGALTSKEASRSTTSARAYCRATVHGQEDSRDKHPDGEQREGVILHNTGHARPWQIEDNISGVFGTKFLGTLLKAKDSSPRITAGNGSVTPSPFLKQKSSQSTRAITIVTFIIREPRTSTNYP